MHEMIVRINYSLFHVSVVLMPINRIKQLL